MEVGGAHGTEEAGQRRWRDGALVQACFRTRRRQGIDDEARTRSSRATPEEAVREGQAGAGLPVLFSIRQGVLGCVFRAKATTDSNPKATSDSEGRRPP